MDELLERGETCKTAVQGAINRIMDILYRAATGLDLQAPRTWDLTNTAVNRLLWTPQGLSLVGWADTSHIDRPAQDEITT